MSSFVNRKSKLFLTCTISGYSLDLNCLNIIKNVGVLKLYFLNEHIYCLGSYMILCKFKLQQFFA